MLYVYERYMQNIFCPSKGEFHIVLIILSKSCDYLNPILVWNSKLKIPARLINVILHKIYYFILNWKRENLCKDCSFAELKFNFVELRAVWYI